MRNARKPKKEKPISRADSRMDNGAAGYINDPGESELPDTEESDFCLYAFLGWEPEEVANLKERKRYAKFLETFNEDEWDDETYTRIKKS